MTIVTTDSVNTADIFYVSKIVAAVIDGAGVSLRNGLQKYGAIHNPDSSDEDLIAAIKALTEDCNTNNQRAACGTNYRIYTPEIIFYILSEEISAIDRDNIGQLLNPEPVVNNVALADIDQDTYKMLIEAGCSREEASKIATIPAPVEAEVVNIEPEPGYVPNENEVALVASEFLKLVDEMIGGDVDLFIKNGDVFYPMIAENTGVLLEHVIEIIGQDFEQ